MTVTTQQSIPDRRLDTLIFQAPSGKTRTFTDDIPYRMDGLHWHAFVEDTERLKIACPEDHASAKPDAVSQREPRSRVDEHRTVEATGTVDGQQVARGYVTDVFVKSAVSSETSVRNDVRGTNVAQPKYNVVAVEPPW
jgi:hypothetical protein